MLPPLTPPSLRSADYPPPGHAPAARAEGSPPAQPRVRVRARVRLEALRQRRLGLGVGVGLGLGVGVGVGAFIRVAVMRYHLDTHPRYHLGSIQGKRARESGQGTHSAGILAVGVITRERTRQIYLQRRHAAVCT